MTEESKKKHQKEEKPLEKMTVKDLKEIALEIPHDHANVAVSDMKKDELISFIKQARGIEEEAPAKKKKKAAVKIALTKKDMKLKIKELHKEKQAARQEKDLNKVHIIRRQTSRLKKRTRKIA